MFLNKIKNNPKFVSATKVARGGKRENISVGNNVSSFSRALTLSLFKDVRAKIFKPRDFL